MKLLPSLLCMLVAVTSFAAKPSTSKPTPNPVAATSPAAETELNRIWTIYQTKLEESLKPQRDAYLKKLEKLQQDAIHANDTSAAAVIQAEHDSAIPGIIPLGTPEKSASSQYSELKRLRADYERQQDQISGPLNTWCSGQLQQAEENLLRQGDAVGAMAVRNERQSLSKQPLRIVNATYGAQGKMADITALLHKAIRFNRLEITVNNSLLDPAPHQPKHGSLTFKVGTGTEKKMEIKENGTLKLP